MNYVGGAMKGGDNAARPAAATKTWRARRGSPDPALGRTAGLQNLSRSSFMETFGRAKCGVGRPAHSVRTGL